MTADLNCPACGDPVTEGDDFCESCGARLTAPPAQEGTCPKCGAPADLADADGYCGRCGYRMGLPGDHVELTEGALALVTDKGLRHHRNEDAGALRAGEGFWVLVVCDGVSTTANPDQASAAAAAAVADAVHLDLSDHPPSAQEASQILADAVLAAQKAVLEVPREEPGGYAQAPSATLVATVVIGDELVTTNVGDSRAYWIDLTESGRSHQLTRDDSLAEAAIAQGETPETAYARRDAHTITRWLGADALDVAGQATITVAEGDGILVVCSDGLWNYFESPETMRELIVAGPEGETTLETARRLVDAALAAGGHDNITVALLPLQGRHVEPSTHPSGTAATVPVPQPSAPLPAQLAPAADPLEEPAEEAGPGLDAGMSEQSWGTAPESGPAEPPLATPVEAAPGEADHEPSQASPRPMPLADPDPHNTAPKAAAQPPAPDRDAQQPADPKE